MFSGLRLRLTLLYLAAALTLLGLVGGGAYGLLTYYFQTTTDQALQHKMAAQFHLLGLALPAELEAADRAWYSERNLLPATPALVSVTQSADAESHDTEDGEVGGSTSLSGAPDEEAYDSELASIFVAVLTPDGQALSGTGAKVVNLAALDSALTAGSDWRTVWLGDGSRARLLTYRVQLSSGPALLQAIRTLADQDRLLSQLLLGLLGLGGLSSLCLGVVSWWLAGRSLVPAQQAWERQQAFVANASHELRTPLTLMRASAEVAQRSLPPGDERRGLLDDVLGEADHMSRLVEDLLLLSRLDAGRLPLERTVIRLEDLLADVQRQVGRLADERGVRLTLDGAGGAARGDPTRARQVLLVLLDNALRHTPKGGEIRLAAQPLGKQIQITVADSGPGISPEHLPRIFERFYQADPARSGPNGGSGLGLAIAKGLVEAQAGQIRVESKVGQGTRVIVTLPAAP